MKNRISITIITKNEVDNIERCLQSVMWADEIIVVDSGSTDGTTDICEKYHCRVFKTEWLGFGTTKKLAVERASHEWILSIDADEVVTPELKTSILALLRGNPECKGYRIRRRSFYLGKMIRFSGWRRDHPVRLFDRRFGALNDRMLHESVVVHGPVGDIHDPLMHYSYPTVSSHITKMIPYSGLGAEILHEQGRSATIPSAVARGILRFIRMFILQMGFLDGRIGFILAYNSAYGVYLKYLRLWELSRQESCT